MKLHMLWAQNPASQEWVLIYSKASTANVQNTPEGKRAVEMANTTHPNWKLHWEVREQ